MGLFNVVNTKNKHAPFKGKMHPAAKHQQEKAGKNKTKTSSACRGWKQQPSDTIDAKELQALQIKVG